MLRFLVATIIALSPFATVSPLPALSPIDAGAPVNVAPVISVATIATLAPFLAARRRGIVASVPTRATVGVVIAAPVVTTLLTAAIFLLLLRSLDADKEIFALQVGKYIAANLDEDRVGSGPIFGLDLDVE